MESVSVRHVSPTVGATVEAWCGAACPRKVAMRRTLAAWNLLSIRKGR